MLEIDKFPDDLQIEVEAKSKEVVISFSIDNQHVRRIVVTFPEDISAYKELAEALFASWGSIFLGQLCLARKITVRTKSFLDIKSLDPIIKNLYEIRSFRDKLPFTSLPKISILQGIKAYNFKIPDRKAACLLFSGGIDSTLSILLLQRNGYDVLPIHVRINEGAIKGEDRAVADITKKMGLELAVVDYDFEDYLEIAKTYSKVIDIYPLENAVPHGRELILIPIAIVFCLLRGSRYICLGHEHNAWKRQIEYLGRKIYRCDTQSEPANMAMQKFINSNISKGLTLFSPVAPLSDYKKFQLLASIRPDIISSTISCYWGVWCGLCHKCSLAYVLQTMLGIDVIKFQQDPLENNQYLRKIVHEWDNESLTNWAEHHYALIKIVKNSLPDDSKLLSYYRNKVLINLEQHAKTLEKSLDKIYKVKLMPRDFRIKT